MKQKAKNKIAVFGTLNVMVCVSLLAAMSIICGKYLAFGVGQVLRFSFENLPVMLSGILFGPVVGMVTGVVADLIGSLMVGYAINPIITLGAAAVGGVSGFVFHLFSKNQRISMWLCLALSVLLAHLCGSVIIKTAGLSAFYDMPYMLLLAWRALNYLIIGVVEYFLMYAVLKNKSVGSMLARVRGK